MMHQKDWSKWCRLCGKKSGSDIDVTLKIENTETLAVAIIKYFGILISNENNCSNKICLMCYDTINSIIKYNAQVVKINEMFIELESNNFNQNINIEILREKYGLNNDSNISNTELEPTICCPLKTMVDSPLNPESKNGDTSVKCFLKTEMLELHEINYTVDPVTIDKEENDKLSKKHSIYEATPKCLNGNKRGKDLNINLKQNNRHILSSHSLQSGEKRFECNICQQKFVTVRGRTVHMKQKHSISVGPSPYRCNVCGRIFKRIQHLNAHKVVHLSENDRKLYDCPQCSKKFTSEWYVQDHIRIVHKKDRPFICELCGAAFGSNRNLVDHHLTHSEEKKFKCSKCEKTFKCKRALKLHVDIHDDTEYICQVCGLKLNTKRILRRHMIVHSDQNKYKCNFCSKQFKRPDAFKNHLILHTGLKPYECSFCELTFANGSNCRKHQRTTHPIELAAAELKGKQKLAKNVPSIKQLKAVNEEALAMENKS